MILGDCYIAFEILITLSTGYYVISSIHFHSSRLIK